MMRANTNLAPPLRFLLCYSAWIRLKAGGPQSDECKDRLNGLGHLNETVETVSVAHRPRITLLKRGVNDRRCQCLFQETCLLLTITALVGCVGCREKPGA